MTLFENGHAESVKAGVHSALGGLAVVCVAYNVCAFWQRRERHLAANVILYGALVALELKKIRHHRDAALIVLLALSCGACVHSTKAIQEGTPITKFTVPGWVPAEALFCVEEPPAVDGQPMVWTPTTCPMSVGILRESFKSLLKADASTRHAPDAALKQHPDGALRNAEVLGELSSGDSSSEMPSANFGGLFWSQLSPWMSDPRPRSAAPFLVHVPDVVGLRAQEQVLDVDTSRVVAVMANGHSGRNRSIREFPSKAVDIFNASPETKLTAFKCVNAADVFDAAVGSRQTVIPEPNPCVVLAAKQHQMGGIDTLPVVTGVHDWSWRIFATGQDVGHLLWRPIATLVSERTVAADPAGICFLDARPESRWRVQYTTSPHGLLYRAPILRAAFKGLQKADQP